MRTAGLWLAVALLSQTALAADSMRCGSRIVSTGAGPAEVLGACGEPDYRDRWFYAQPGVGTVGDVEEWTYNFGPNLLLHLLRFRHGKLVAVDTEGYGFAEGPRACTPSDLFEGLSKYRLLARCGEPVTREALNTLQPLRRRDGRIQGTQLQSVYRERWVYDFGADYLQQTVTLENGRVVSVDSGSRGFDHD